MPAEPTAYQKLTARQRKFVDAYLGEARGNATKAARLAGYAHPMQQGTETRHTPAVAAVIEDLLNRNAMSAPEVLWNLADVARGNMADFVEVGGSDLSDEAKGYLSWLIETCDTALAEIREEGALPPGVPEQIEKRREEIQQIAEHLNKATQTRPWVFNLEKAQREGLLHLVAEIAQTEHGTKLKLHDRVQALMALGRHHGLFTVKHEVEVKDDGAADAVKRKLAGLAARLGAGDVPGEPDGSGSEGA